MVLRAGGIGSALGAAVFNQATAHGAPSLRCALAAAKGPLTSRL